MTSARLALLDASELRLGDERADVEAIGEGERQRRLAGGDELARLDEAMHDDGVGRRAQLGFVDDGLRLRELRPGARDFVLRLLRSATCASPSRSSRSRLSLRARARPARARGRSSRDRRRARCRPCARAGTAAAAAPSARARWPRWRSRDVGFGRRRFRRGAAGLEIADARLAPTATPDLSRSTASAVSPRSRRTSRSPALTRSPSRTSTSMTRPVTFGARSTSVASMRPLRRMTFGSSACAAGGQREQRRRSARRREAWEREESAFMESWSASRWRDRAAACRLRGRARPGRGGSAASAASATRGRQIVLPRQHEERRGQRRR